MFQVWVKSGEWCLWWGCIVFFTWSGKWYKRSSFNCELLFDEAAKMASCSHSDKMNILWHHLPKNPSWTSNLDACLCNIPFPKLSFVLVSSLVERCPIWYTTWYIWLDRANNSNTPSSFQTMTAAPLQPTTDQGQHQSCLLAMRCKGKDGSGYRAKKIYNTCSL